MADQHEHKKRRERSAASSSTHHYYEGKLMTKAVRATRPLSMVLYSHSSAVHHLNRMISSISQDYLIDSRKIFARRRLHRCHRCLEVIFLQVGRRDGSLLHEFPFCAKFSRFPTRTSLKVHRKTMLSMPEKAQKSRSERFRPLGKALGLIVRGKAGRIKMKRMHTRVASTKKQKNSTQTGSRKTMGRGKIESPDRVVLLKKIE